MQIKIISWKIHGAGKNIFKSHILISTFCSIDYKKRSGLFLKAPLLFWEQVLFNT
jgi:hypothetical protein